MTILVLLFALTALVGADPREAESVDIQEEFGRSVDDTRSIQEAHHLIFDLEHQLTPDAPFTPRGAVEITIHASNSKPQVSFSELPPLDQDDIDKFQTLVRQNRHYTVRAKADPLDPDSAYVVTSVPMCMLAKEGLREDFAFHLSDSGKLMAIEYLTPFVGFDACIDEQLTDGRLDPFGTVLMASDGSVPLENFIVKRNGVPQGVKPVKSEDEKDEPEEQNQSFLRKYWFIILPIVIMSLMGGDGGAGTAPEAPRRR